MDGCNIYTPVILCWELQFDSHHSVHCFISYLEKIPVPINDKQELSRFY